MQARPAIRNRGDEVTLFSLEMGKTLILGLNTYSVCLSGTDISASILAAVRLWREKTVLLNPRVRDEQGGCFLLYLVSGGSRVSARISAATLPEMVPRVSHWLG